MRPKSHFVSIRRELDVLNPEGLLARLGLAKASLCLVKEFEILVEEVYSAPVVPNDDASAGVPVDSPHLVLHLVQCQLLVGV